MEFMSGGDTLSMARMLFVCILALTAPAALVGLATSLVRHFLEPEKDDTRPLFNRATRILAGLLAIGALGYGGVDIANHFTDGVSAQNGIEDDSGRVGSDGRIDPAALVPDNEGWNPGGLHTMDEGGGYGGTGGGAR